MESFAFFLKSVVGAHLLLALMTVGPGRASSPSLPVPGPQETQGRETERPELPDTALGRIMRQWFAVIQSGKEEEIKSFVESHFSSNAFRHQQSAAEYVALFRKLHEQSGGLDVVRVSPGGGAQPLSVIARSRRGRHYALVRAGLDSAEKGKLAGLGVDKAAAPDAPRLSDTSRPLSEEEMVASIQRDLDRR